MSIFQDHSTHQMPLNQAHEIVNHLSSHLNPTQRAYINGMMESAATRHGGEYVKGEDLHKIFYDMEHDTGDDINPLKTSHVRDAFQEHFQKSLGH